MIFHLAIWYLLLIFITQIFSIITRICWNKQVSLFLPCALLWFCGFCHRLIFNSCAASGYLVHQQLYLLFVLPLLFGQAPVYFHCCPLEGSFQLPNQSLLLIQLNLQIIPHTLQIIPHTAWPTNHTTYSLTYKSYHIQLNLQIIPHSA